MRRKSVEAKVYGATGSKQTFRAASPATRGEVPNAAVVGISQTDLPHGCCRKSLLAKPAGEGRWTLSVHQKLHRSGAPKNGMIKVLGCVSDAGADVVWLQIGKILQNLLLRNTCGQHVEHILDPNPHPTDTGPPPTLRGVNRDALQCLHR